MPHPAPQRKKQKKSNKTTLYVTQLIVIEIASFSSSSSCDWLVVLSFSM
jgi:hypothetical protein